MQALKGIKVLGPGQLISTRPAKDSRFNGPLPGIPDPRVPGRCWISLDFAFQPLSNSASCRAPARNCRTCSRAGLELPVRRGAHASAPSGRRAQARSTRWRTRACTVASAAAASRAAALLPGLCSRRQRSMARSRMRTTTPCSSASSCRKQRSRLDLRAGEFLTPGAGHGDAKLGVWVLTRSRTKFDAHPAMRSGLLPDRARAPAPSDDRSAGRDKLQPGKIVAITLRIAREQDESRHRRVGANVEIGQR